jgi:hypothetical protein
VWQNKTSVLRQMKSSDQRLLDSNFAVKKQVGNKRKTRFVVQKNTSNAGKFKFVNQLN